MLWKSEKIPARWAIRYVQALASQLSDRERIEAFIWVRNLEPAMDAIAITNRRVIAICNEDLATGSDTFRHVVHRREVAGVDIATEGKTKTLALILADGGTISYGEIEDDAERLRRIILAWRPGPPGAWEPPDTLDQST